MVRRRGRSRPWSTPALALLGLGLLGLGLGLGLLLSQQGCRPKNQRGTPPADPVPAPQPPKPQKLSTNKRGPSSPAPEGSSASPKPRLRSLPEDSRPRVAVVIDDLGHGSPEWLERLGKLGIPVTVAALPFQEQTRMACERARSLGFEILLHLPMEPLGYPGPHKNPGPGAILASDREAEIRSRVKAAISEVPKAAGVNNHMGSRITPDRARMTWVLEEVKARGLFFVDSRTEKDSLAFEISRKLGIPTVQRKVFLDDDRTQKGIAQQWARAMSLAEREREVLIIGHYQPETIEALESLVPGSKSRIHFVPASALAE